MTPNEYQELARRTECDYYQSSRRLAQDSAFWSEQSFPYARLDHAVRGIAGEAGEMLDVVQKVVEYGESLGHSKRVNLKEEIGDLLWYVAQLCNVLDVSMETMMEQNIAKLRERFPEKFSTERAEESNRDRDAEARAVDSRK